MSAFLQLAFPLRIVSPQILQAASKHSSMADFEKLNAQGVDRDFAMVLINSLLQYITLRERYNNSLRAKMN